MENNSIYGSGISFCPSLPNLWTFAPSRASYGKMWHGKKETSVTGFSSFFSHFCYLETNLGFQALLISFWTDFFFSSNTQVSALHQYQYDSEHGILHSYLRDRLFEKLKSTLDEFEFFPNLSKLVLTCSPVVKNVIFFTHLPIRTLKSCKSILKITCQPLINYVPK